MHFDLAEKYKLPMYLHSRNCKEDFLKILKENRHKFSTGVVHSYTGDLEELNELINLGLYIGVNGCSFKTEENLKIVKQIPLDRIMIETG
jgi:TatD DNase family protein